MKTHCRIHRVLVSGSLVMLLILGAARAEIGPPHVRASSAEVTDEALATHRYGHSAVSIPVPHRWKSQDRGSHTRAVSPDGRLAAYVLTTEGSRLDDIGPAILGSMGKAGDGLVTTNTIPVIDTDLVAVLYDTPHAEEYAYAICIKRDGMIHALVFRGMTEAFRRHIDPVNSITDGFEVEGRGRVIETSLTF